MSNRPAAPRIAIIAGEASGDNLAAELLETIRMQYPDAVFEGIAGPRMQAAGCVSLAPMELLSVMGLFEVLGHLPGLLRLRARLRRHFLAARPDVFVGVDAPDFNLGLARALKHAGIPALQYVSPSVWAWRRYRVRKIAKSVDRILTLFPFEADFYRSHDVEARFVGHPLADRIADSVDVGEARARLGMPVHGTHVALLPGSRVGEVRRLAGVFLETAAWCRQRAPDLQFVVPLANAACRHAFEDALAKADTDLPLTLVGARGLEVMAAADAVLLSSGTATLECALLKRPMVVAYRLAPFSYALLRRLVKTPYVALPNLLAGRRLVEEFIQHDARPEQLGPALLAVLEDAGRRDDMLAGFHAIHDDLRRDASRHAAANVLELAGYGR